MSTILFHNIVFGPIKSRRLGNSLGVNLLPDKGKLCTFDCIYCECGWNKDGRTDSKLPSKADVCAALEFRLHSLKEEGTPIDTITFSGNGEPTIHPDFPDIIDHTIALRDKLYPSAVISVLSNASQIGKKEIRDALMKIDNPILKIDGGCEELILQMDHPQFDYSLDAIKENLSFFNGNYILQTMFLRGQVDGKIVDSTDKVYADQWVKMVLDLRPREVMMYTIDRETPAKELEKISVEEMKVIAAPLVEAGIIVQIRG